MAKAAMRRVLGAAKVDASALTDAELLRRFGDGGDQAAFATLVRRHTNLVLGVCRRSLPAAADAEDACQAVFVVLARKAKVTRWQPSVANWLYTTARKVSRDARVAAERRARREAKAGVPEATPREGRMSAREWLATLDDELDRLPLIYREPLVLCYLEGVSREDAAVRLGVPVATVKTRLERGRKRLGEALTQRGVVIGLSLLALAATSPAGASPPRLVESVLAAVNGSPSPAVVALAQGAAVNGFLTRTKLLAVVGLVTIGFGLAAVFAADPPKPADQTEKLKADVKGEPKQAEDKPKVRTITGTVVGHDGKPMEAELSVIWVEGKTERLGRSKNDGRFSVTVPLKFKGHGGWLVVAAPGHGSDFHPNGMDHIKQSMTASADLIFRLPKERPIEGRILDQQGKPVAGATVTLASVSTFDSDVSRDNRLKKWATDLFLRGIPPEGDRGMWFPKESQRQRTVTTDTDGRYQLTGVGVGQMARFKLTGRGVADTEVVTLNADGFDPEATNKLTRDHEYKEFGGKWVLSGPDPTTVMENEKVIRGSVTDHEGKPRAGVRVAFSRLNKQELNPDYNQAVTDEDGKYEIRGARKHTGYMVEVDSDPAVGLLPCQGFADDTVGYEPIVIDLKCARGVVVSGRVTNKATGEPVVAQMYADVLVNNPFVEKYPPLLHAASLASPHTQTDKDGKYRVVVIPGPVILMAGPRHENRAAYRPAVADPEYADRFQSTEGSLLFSAYGGGQGFVQGCWCKVLNAKETDTEVKQDIQLEPATRVTVRVVDGDGKPVTGTRAAGVEVAEFTGPTEFTDTDTLTVLNLDSKKPRLLSAVHTERKLVGTLTLTADAKDPVVKLGSGGTVTGRAVDKDGKPLAGLAVHIAFTHRPVSEMHEALYQVPPETDANGEFRVETVFPGEEFRVMFYRRGKYLGPDFDKLPRHSVAKHSDTLKFGDIKIEPAEGGEE